MKLLPATEKTLVLILLNLSS